MHKSTDSQVFEVTQMFVRMMFQETFFVELSAQNV